MRFQGDETELICLNWAENVHEWSGQMDKPWHNIGGSAWNLRPDKFDKRDEALCSNHRRGLYYTWLKPLRSHALFFNYRPATFFLEATKVAHIGVPGAVSRRRGPQLRRTHAWDGATAAWVEIGDSEDGSPQLSMRVVMQETTSSDLRPLILWRRNAFLPSCAGDIGSTDDWHDVRQLDSCVIDSSEVIRRITFCQDTDIDARNFRIARLIRCGRLWNILTTHEHLPPALADLKDGFHLEWSADFPHQNAVSAQGQRATVIYMGEEANHNQIEATAKTVAEFLHRAFPNPDESISAKQRLAVWFRDAEEIELFDAHLYVKIDQPRTTSEFDIGGKNDTECFADPRARCSAVSGLRGNKRVGNPLYQGIW